MDKRTKWLMGIFLLVELMLYIAILFLNLPLPSGLIHYASIVLCLLFVFLLKQNDRETQIIRFAMIFTVLADLFLTLLGIQKLLGTIFFTIAQLAYATRLIHHETKAQTGWLLVRIVFVALMELVAWWVVRSHFDWLIFFAVFYYANLLANAVHALLRFRQNPLFALGLCLYLCCDLMVGLSNSSGYVNLPVGSIWAFLLSVPFNLTWFFYLPSQVLIVLSVVSKRT